jgi:hypothetical protein
MAGAENQTPNQMNQMELMLHFAGEGAFQKSSWSVGKIYVVRNFLLNFVAAACLGPCVYHLAAALNLPTSTLD